MDSQENLTPQKPVVMSDQLINWCAGIVTSPVQTLREIVAGRPVGAGLLVMVVVAAITGAASANSFGDALSVQPSLLNIIFGALLGIFITVPVLAVSAFFVHLISRLFGGKGSYTGLFAAFGFTSIINIFSLPLVVLDIVDLQALSALALIGQLGLLAWAVVLTVVAIRENYVVTTGVAIGILLVTLIALVLVTFVLVFVVVLLLILSVGLLVN